MHETAKRLYEAALDLKGIKGKSKLARYLNESPQTLKNWELRGVSKAGMVKAEALIGCRTRWLDTGKGPRELGSLAKGLLEGYAKQNIDDYQTLKLYQVPLVSWVTAGDWAEVNDALADDWNFVETSYKARSRTFALVVSGPSMEPKFPNGCTIIVEPDEAPVNGSYVIVRQNGDQEATFKQLVIDSGKTYLKALNPEWPKRIIEMMPDAVIIGVVKKMEMDV